MDSIERILCAVYLEEPDVVPVFDLGIDTVVVKKILGREPKSVYDHCECHVKLGMDAFFLWDPGVSASFEISPENAALYQGKIKVLGPKSWIDGWGRKWIYRDDTNTCWYAGGTIEQPEQLDEIEPPSPDSDALKDFFRKAVKASRKAGLAFGAGIHDAFEIPSEMRGIDNFLIDCYRNPRFVKRMIEMAMEYNIGVTKLVIDEGADIVASGDDYAWKTGPLMSPKHFEKFIFPHLKELVNIAHKRGVPFLKHTDGNIWLLMDYLIKAGVDILNPFEPQAGMDIGEAKEKIGDKICLAGNVDCVHVLSRGTKEEVYREVKECIKKAAYGGGYILTSSNTLHSGVNPQNAVAMVKAAKKYGRYR